MTDSNQNDAEKVPGTSGVLIQAKGVTIQSRDGVSLLSDISFHIEPGELVALTGISRSGTSVILQCLAGLLKPASGEVLIDGVDLYANLDAFRPMIGYVPAQLALHQNLTVEEILQDAARLRLPRSTSSADRKQRQQTVLETVGLTHVKDRQAVQLSQAEKRKLSIAVELISYPKMLLLDESAEPLTPFEEVQINLLMRELSRQGTTIIQVNPRSRNAGLSDKVIFLAPGGVLAWFGPADEAFTYLKRFLPRGVVKDLFGLQEALEMLVNPQAQDGVEWARRFRDDAAYEKYVDDPLNNKYPDLLLQTRPLLRIRLRNSSKEKLPPRSTPRANVIQKFFMLVRRGSRLLWRDRTGLFLLAAPPLVALAHLFLTSIMPLNSGFPPTAPSLLVFLVILTAAFLMQNEISKDRVVYQRDNRTSPLLFPYIMSKAWLVGLFAIYQGLAWTVIHSLGVLGSGLAGALQVLFPTAIILTLVSFVGGILGLIVSALSGAEMRKTGWVLLLTFPLLLFMMNPLAHWSRLVIISVFLIVVLMGIQHRTASVRA